MEPANRLEQRAVFRHDHGIDQIPVLKTNGKRQTVACGSREDRAERKNGDDANGQSSTEVAAHVLGSP